jgi:LysM repeat protein
MVGPIPRSLTLSGLFASALLGGCALFTAQPAAPSAPAVTAKSTLPAISVDPVRRQPMTDEAEGADDHRSDSADRGAPSYDRGNGLIEDDVEGNGTLQPLRPQPAREHPLDRVSRGDLEKRLREAPEGLGSMSLGGPSGGALFNAVRMPESTRWELVASAHAFGTQETIDYLSRAIAKVHEVFPGSPKLFIGHISAERGGHLRPHVSHQAGRDVDISYFYLEGHRWYGRATAKNLDRARTWCFVRALITETDVEMILIDAYLQSLLREHALQIGEDPHWIQSLFLGADGLPPIIRHAKGHATHLHIRFFNPIAQETARRLYPLLVRNNKITPPTQYLRHRAKEGETLGRLAKKYGTTIQAIQRANGLRKTLIRAGHDYLIPRSGGVRISTPAVAVPPRRLPPRAPTRTAGAGPRAASAR